MNSNQIVESIEIKRSLLHSNKKMSTHCYHCDMKTCIIFAKNCKRFLFRAAIPLITRFIHIDIICIRNEAADMHKQIHTHTQVPIRFAQASKQAGRHITHIFIHIVSFILKPFLSGHEKFPNELRKNVIEKSRGIASTFIHFIYIYSH